MLFCILRLFLLTVANLTKAMTKTFTSVTRFIIVLSGLTACAPEMVKKQTPVDFTQLGRIQLEIADDKQASMPEDLSRQVTKNLTGWNYPVGEKDGQTFSHLLKATIGEVKFGNTPSGFSFSAGNSDPRAIDFQKTDVLPISCRLTSIPHPEQTRELSMGFTSSTINIRSLAIDKLADHVSTVCFNLLSEIKWPNHPGKESTQSIHPTWIPEIRIETKEEPVNKNTPANSISVVPNEEPRKQIIIHNQGSPVIFQFGHERR